MRALPISVDQGRVSTRDPSMLQEGELATAQDVEYLPYDPGLYPVAGRSAVASGVGSPYGGRQLRFTGDYDDLIVLANSDKLRKAVLGNTLTFADFAEAAGTLEAQPASLDHAFWQNEHFLFMGGSIRNRVVNETGACKYHGMLANITPPTLTFTGAGPTITLPSGQVIRYWLEERVKVGTDIVKRNASSDPESVVSWTGDGTGKKPRLTLPATVNPDVTHLALFSGGADDPFPIGAEIAEIAVGAATFIDDTRSTPVLPGGVAYSITTLVLRGLTTQIPTWGPVPRSTSGDFIEDTLLMNDVENPQGVWFAVPGNPHAVPASNFITFPEKSADTVHAVHRIGDGAVCLLDNSAWVIHTLPQPEEVAFQTERVKREVEGSYGTTGPLASCKFSFGRGPLVASVTPTGVHYTDGSSWSPLSDDMDWESEVNVGALSSAVLINNSRRGRLELMAVGSDGTRKRWFFYYHPFHQKEGQDGGIRAKFVGPITRSERVLFPAWRNGIHEVYSADASGTVYREYEGMAVPGGACTYDVKTGVFYIAGLGQEATIDGGYIHHSAAPGVSATWYLRRIRAGADDFIQNDSAVNMARNELTATFKRANGEAFQFGLSATNPAVHFRLNLFAVDVTSFLASQSKRS